MRRHGRRGLASLAIMVIGSLAPAAVAEAAVHVSKSGGAVTIDAGELPPTTGAPGIYVDSSPDLDAMGQPTGFFNLRVWNGGSSSQQYDFTAGPGCTEEGNAIKCEMTTSVDYNGAPQRETLGWNVPHVPGTVDTGGEHDIIGISGVSPSGSTFNGGPPAPGFTGGTISVGLKPVTATLQNGQVSRPAVDNHPATTFTVAGLSLSVESGSNVTGSSGGDFVVVGGGSGDPGGASTIVLGAGDDGLNYAPDALDEVALDSIDLGDGTDRLSLSARAGDSAARAFQFNTATNAITETTGGASAKQADVAGVERYTSPWPGAGVADHVIDPGGELKLAALLAGNDVAQVANGVAQEINCGAGTDDVVSADADDELIDCESEPGQLVVNDAGDGADVDTSDGACDADDGQSGLQCTLRAAIQEANEKGAVEEPVPVTFELPAGEQTIAVAAPLPAVEVPANINGGLPDGGRVRIDGAGAGGAADGLRLRGGRSEVRRLVVTRFGANGIVIDGGIGARVTDSAVGTLPDGACAAPCGLGNGASGVRIQGDASQSIVGRKQAVFGPDEGGTSIANVIANNGDDAVTIVSGNQHDVAGNAMYGNGDLAIDLGDDGVSSNDANDADTGPNALLNAPTATATSVAERVDGSQRKGQAVYFGAANANLRWIVYAAESCASPFAAQADRLASSYPLSTDESGYDELGVDTDIDTEYPLAGAVTFAAVDAAGNTSELSNCVDDTDGDAIADAFERDGADLDRDGEPEVPLDRWGAKVGKHDVFVEVDWMTGHALDIEALTRVQQAFADAPHQNPDGSTGVRLHIDNGAASPMLDGGTWGADSDSDEMPQIHPLNVEKVEGSTSGWEAFEALKQEYLPRGRRPFFRYVISARELSVKGLLGLADGIPGSDMMLGLGGLCEPEGTDCPGPVDAHAGGFMHELGHLLGLKHGGDDHNPFKPHHFSVMNYLYVPGTFANLPGMPPAPRLDYSQVGPSAAPGPLGSVAALDENSIDEPAGIVASGAGPGQVESFHALRACVVPDPDPKKKAYRVHGIPTMNAPTDFNCDGDATDTGVAHDMDDSGFKGKLEAVTEWDRIKFHGGSVGGGALAELPVEVEPLRVEHFRDTAPVLWDDAEDPKVAMTTTRGDGRATVVVAASDNRQLDSLVVTVDGAQRTVRATGAQTGNASPNVATLEHPVILGPGTHTVRAVAFDRAMHQSVVVTEQLTVGAQGGGPAGGAEPPPNPGLPAGPPAPPAALVPPAPPGSGDATAPQLSAAALRPSTLRGTRKARLSFSSSEPARVTVVVRQAVAGRRRGRRCVATRARRGRRCTIQRRVGRPLVHAAKAGPNELTVSRRVAGRKLRPGRYILELQAADAAGNASGVVTVRLSVRR